MSEIICEIVASKLQFIIVLPSSQVYDTDTRIDSIQSTLDTAVARSPYNSSHELLIEAVAPTCQEFILECQLGNKVGVSVVKTSSTKNHFFEFIIFVTFI